MDTLSIYVVTFIDGHNIEVDAISVKNAAAIANDRLVYQGEIVKVECLTRK